MIRLAYRADINGLRAIAIILVVCYHSFPSWMTSGFVGVDIFFVISGFLISTNIFQNLEHNKFSFAIFYSRRILRIFPALLIILISSFVFGAWVLFADEYAQLNRHVANGSVFLSNFLLLREASYFDNASETKPLLHLWSLAIEEQFYIVWPLFLWMIWKLRLNVLLSVILLAISSFIFNVVYTVVNPVAAFYLMPCRLWELGIGAALAHVCLYIATNEKLVAMQIEAKSPICPAEGSIRKISYDQFSVNGYRSQRIYFLISKHRDIVTLLGMSAVLLSAFLIPKSPLFLAVWILLPTLGVALTIWAGSDAWLNRMILSRTLLTWIGTISYPLYLWHWPLLSFARIIEEETPAVEIRIAAIAIAIILSWMTCYIVERPLRSRRDRMVVPVIVLIFTMLLVGGLANQNNNAAGMALGSVIGQQNSPKDDVLGSRPFFKYMKDHFYPCTPSYLYEKAIMYGDDYVKTIHLCFQSHNTPHPQMAIIGDSHAEHLFAGLAEALPNINIAFYAKYSHPYIEGSEFEDIFSYVLQENSISTILLTAHWQDRLRPEVIPDHYMEKFDKVLSVLHAAGKTIYLTDDSPTFTFDPQKCASARFLSSGSRCSESKAIFDMQHARFTAFIEPLLKDHPYVTVIPTAHYFCDNHTCTMRKDGKLLYRDNQHLSIDGSKYVGKIIARTIINSDAQLINELTLSH